MSEKLSFFKLLKNSRIRIPNLQRAYAQGRNNDKALEIRSNFITDMLAALLADAAEQGGNELSLDTVYGERTADTFVPLDGQQRLTTLFLLHLYLACYEHKDTAGFLKDENGKSRFTYATRVASEDFCNYMVNHDFHIGSSFDEKTVVSAKRDKNGNEIEGLTQRIIKSDMDFQWTWYNDPTIESMLNMLDTIHKIFSPYKERFSDFYDALCRDEAPVITFWYQEISGTIPADELYIRMNARGLALTEFENFKAALLHFLRDNDNTDKKLRETVRKITDCIDSEWLNAFWEFCIKRSDTPNDPLIASLVDRRILRVLHICILFQVMEKYIHSDSKIKGGKAFTDLIGDFRKKKQFDHYNLFQCSFFTGMSAEEKQTLGEKICAIMALVSGQMKDQSQLDHTDKLLDDLFSEKEGSFDRLLRFYVRYYMFPEVSEANRNAYSVLKHLIKYTYITEFKDFENALAALFHLKSCGGDFITRFRECENATEFLHKGFATNQSWEEHFKLRLKQNEMWRECIDQAERDTFFAGQCLFLFECVLAEEVSGKSEIDAIKTIIKRADDAGLREKFRAYFDLFTCTHTRCPENLRKGLILQSISEMPPDKLLPDYPFTPEYAKNWRKESPDKLYNPGSMIIDKVNADDKLNWKRVLRIDLTDQHNDKPVYRRLIKSVLGQVLNSAGENCDEKWNTFIREKLMAQKTDWADPVTANVCSTLLEWCRQKDWSECYQQGIRLYENGQLYLLKGDAARISKDYQELHMMLLLPALREKYKDAVSGDYGCLIIPQKVQEMSVILDYANNMVHIYRSKNAVYNSKPADFKTCEYAIDKVLEMLQEFSIDIPPASPAGSAASAQ